MNFDNLFDCDTMSEVQVPFNSLCSDHLDVIELQPVANVHNGSLSEEDKNNVRKLLDNWNMEFLFKTCLGEYNIFYINNRNN